MTDLPRTELLCGEADKLYLRKAGPNCPTELVIVEGNVTEIWILRIGQVEGMAREAVKFCLDRHLV